MQLKKAVLTLRIVSGHVAGDDSRGDAQSSQTTAEGSGEVPALSKLDASFRLEVLAQNLFRVQPCTWRLSISEVFVPVAYSQSTSRLVCRD